MIPKRYWDATEAQPEPFRSCLRADYRFVDAIFYRLHKHPEKNPLKNQVVLALANVAIEKYSDDSVGRNFEAYLSSTLEMFPDLKAHLSGRGYLSEIEVAVEADTSEDSTELLVESEQ